MAEQSYTIIPEHSRKAPVWANFNLVQFPDGERKAQCKRCGEFLKPGSNSTLKIEEELGLSSPVTDTSDTSSVGTVSRYDDDEEEPDTDRLDDNTAVERLIKYNSLEEYNPDTTTYYTPYNPNNYNPWYYDSSGAGGLGTSGY